MKNVNEIFDIDDLISFIGEGYVSIPRECRCGIDPEGRCPFCSAWSKFRNNCEKALENYNLNKL